MTYRASALASIILLASVLAGPQAVAAPTRITFDAGDPIGGLAVGATLGNQYAAYGVTFAPNAYSGNTGPNGDWASNTTMSIASSTGGDVGGLGTPSLVSGNLLRAYSGWLNEDGDPSFSAFFSGGINSFSADFAGVSAPADVRLFAYLGSTLLGSVSSTVTTGQFTLSFASIGQFDRVVITPGSYGDWVGVDNITFDRAALPPTGVPEPTTMAMLGLGLTGLALARRRAGRSHR
jgi:hypothetical protein